MAVPSSGPLQLRGDINLEVNGNVTDTNVALHQLSIDAGFSSPDAMSDFYGYSSVVPPSVTSSPSSFSNSVMTTNGNVTDTGGEDVTRGFYWGTNANANTNNTKYTKPGTQGTGAFTCTFNVAYTTAYYNWAFACNSAGEVVGAKISSTSPYPPYTPVFQNAATALCSQVCLTLDGMTGCYPGFACANASTSVGYVNPFSGAWTGTAGENAPAYFSNSDDGHTCGKYCSSGGVFSVKGCACNFFKSNQHFRTEGFNCAAGFQTYWKSCSFLGGGNRSPYNGPTPGYYATWRGGVNQTSISTYQQKSSTVTEFSDLQCFTPGNFISQTLDARACTCTIFCGP